MKKGTTEEGVVFHAGFPNAAEDEKFGSLSLDGLVVKHRSSTFFWRLETEVAELSWSAGSLLVVDRSLTPKNASLAVVVTDDGFVLARFKKGRFVKLNDEAFDTELQLWGVVTYCLQTLSS